MSSNSTTSPGWFHRYFIPALLIGYLLVTLLLCAIVVVRLWPANDFVKAVQESRVRRDVALSVTQNSLNTIDTGLTVMVRWDASGTDALTRLDRINLSQALAAAVDLPGFKQREPVEAVKLRGLLPDGNVKAVTAKNRGAVIAWLTDINKALHQRQENLSQLPSLNMRCPLFSRPDTDWAKALNPAFGPLESSENRRLLTPAPDAKPVPISYFGSPELDMLILFIAFGALGASTQGLSSLSKYIGVDKFVSRWAVYYLARPFIGMVLALAFYVVLRAGIFTPDVQIDQANIYGGAAVALLVGLFSAQAMEKLKSVAESFFSASSSRNSLDERHPFVSEVEVTYKADKKEWTIEVKGQRFSRESYVILGSDVYGVNNGMTYIDETHLTIVTGIQPKLYNEQRALVKVAMVKPGADGGLSNFVDAKWVVAPKSAEPVATP